MPIFCLSRPAAAPPETARRPRSGGSRPGYEPGRRRRVRGCCVESRRLPRRPRATEAADDSGNPQMIVIRALAPLRGFGIEAPYTLRGRLEIGAVARRSMDVGDVLAAEDRQISHPSRLPRSRSPGHGPGPERPLVLQPQVEMQTRGGVLLDDEPAGPTASPRRRVRMAPRSP